MLYTTLLIASILFSHEKSNDGKAINDIIGDVSFVSKFGHQPDVTTNDDLRIKTHLEYVEKMLRKKDVSFLNIAQQEKRKHILDLLHNYWTTGIFPRNYEYNVRKPCFIDKDGRICAVGFLIEKTAGRCVAEKINHKFKYKEFLEMKDETVNEWIESSGLTIEECAMIQPTYGPPPSYNYNYITPRYGIASSVLGGVNFSLSAINAIQIGKGTNSRVVPVVSLLSGTGSIVYGIVNFPKNEWIGLYARTNESQKALSLLNIGLGTTTLILGTWNLVANSSNKQKLTSWNLYSCPTANSQMGIGINFTHKM